jgi:hypothetical protein
MCVVKIGVLLMLVDTMPQVSHFLLQRLHGCGQRPYLRAEVLLAQKAFQLAALRGFHRKRPPIVLRLRRNADFQESYAGDPRGKSETFGMRR